MNIVEKNAAIFLAVVLTTTVSAQEAKHVAANGSSFAYAEAGSGPPVVLIHGSMFDYREWSKQIKPLARHYRVIAYSRRYHWPNAPPTANADASLEVQVEDLAAIIKILKIGPAHLVGHSYGGAVALQLALRHPELVRTLVLAEPGVAGVLTAGPEDEAARKEGQAGRAEMTEVFASGDAERIMRTYATRVAPGAYEKAGREIRQTLLDNAPAFQLDYNSRRPAFTCEIAGQITAPALFLAGERSPPGLQHVAGKAASCLKSAKFLRIPDATHWIPHDQPQKFNDALLDFLANYAQPNELVQRVDHLVYATPDLDRGIAEIEKLVGVRATFGGKHPGRGTKNAFIALGPNSFLEIVAPDPDQPPPNEPRPFFKGLTESRLVRWFINSRNVGRDRDEAISKGVPYGEVKSGSRQRPDGVQVSWRFTDPAKPVADGVVPFIIDWADTPHPSQTAANGATLISLRAEHPDPQYAKRLLRALALKLSVKRGNRPTLIATIEGPRGRVELK